MKTTLRKIGNSQGVLLPKPLLAQIGVVGDELEMSVEDNAIVLRRARKVREGWAEAAAEVDAAGEYDSEWLEADLGELDHEAEWVW